MAVKYEKQTLQARIIKQASKYANQGVRPTAGNNTFKESYQMSWL